MRLDEALDFIEGCKTLDELRQKFQLIIENYGFSSYALLEISRPDLSEPFSIPTSEKRWAEEYKLNAFIDVDPVLSFARRTNRSFTWSEAPAPSRLGKRKPGAMRIMDAARDHGFQDGLVIPFHTVDRMGRTHSYSCGFFWRDRGTALRFMLRSYRTDLHILLIYWAQAIIDMKGDDRLAGQAAADTGRAPELTDRERLMLEWAARGKTALETAVILSISDETVETHLRNAMRKLGAVNKTQAAVTAIKLGLIDV